MRFIIGIAVIVLLAGCGAATPPTEAPSESTPTGGAVAPNIADTRWQLQQMIIGGSEHTLVGSQPITLEFMATELGGFGGCNSYGGPYQIDGDTLTIEQLAVTARACAETDVMNQEQTFLQALSATHTYTMTDGALTLTNGTNELRFTATSGGSTGGEMGSNVTDTRWQLQQMIIGGNEHTLVGSQPITLEFMGTELGGSGGCNNYSGSYQVDGNTLTVGQLASTLKACPETDVMDQEQIFLQALSATHTYTMTDGALTLTNGTNELRFVPLTTTAAPLQGTTWNLNAIERTEADAVSTTAIVEAATLQIEGDRASGTTGCNRYNGTVTIDGSNISFGPLMTTRMACPEPIMAQEQALLNAFSSAKSFTIEGPTLRIEFDGGTLVWTANP